MALTWDDVVAIAPELCKLQLPTQTAILASVARQVQCGSEMAELGGDVWLAAHLGTLARRRGEAPFASKDAGGMSAAYVNQLSLAGLYSTTSYGVEFTRLARTTTAVLGLVGD